MRSRLYAHLLLILLIYVVFITGEIKAAEPQPVAQPEAQAAQQKQTQPEFVAEVRNRFDHEDFAALDNTAFEARTSKERFPGAEWKLYVFYQALTWPDSGVVATDEQWKSHLGRLQKWVNTSSDSMTARIALASGWVEYANKAWTSAQNWSQIERQIGGKQYQERIRQAEKALSYDPVKLMTRFLSKVKREYSTKTSSQLNSHCPHWYVVKLAIEQSRPWEWSRYNNFFAEGVALEPTYYYLYKTKAADLLPQRHGSKYQWESFADNSARNIGGKEGEIAYYLIIAHIRGFFDNSVAQDSFFKDNVIQWTRVLESYKKLEETYGASDARLNEMALLASSAKQYSLAKVYFDRIGENWEGRVWRHKAAFDAHRNLAKAKAVPQQAAGWTGGPYDSTPPKREYDYSGLRATLSSRSAQYQKSADVLIEALIENPGEGEMARIYELAMPALSMVIQDTKRKSTVMLMPQASDPSQVNRALKPGEIVRFNYRITFPLPPGEYVVKMKSLNSNELLIKVGAQTGTRRRR